MSRKRPWIDLLRHASELGCVACKKRTWFKDDGQEVRCWNCGAILRRGDGA